MKDKWEKHMSQASQDGDYDLWKIAEHEVRTYTEALRSLGAL